MAASKECVPREQWNRALQESVLEVRKEEQEKERLADSLKKQGGFYNGRINITFV